MVVALWMLAALAALALVASAYVAQSAVSLAAIDGETQFEMLTSAGIELTAYQLSAPITVRRPTSGSHRFSLAGASAVVEYTSESARINLNLAPASLIAGLFTALGAQPEAADQYARRIVAWRSAQSPNREQDEDALYLSAGLKYLPRHGSFTNANELVLVLGIPRAMAEQALRFVTVYSNMAEINALIAAPEVVAALPDMTPARLDAFLRQRETLPPDDPSFVLGALGGPQKNVTLNPSPAYRIRIRMVLRDGRQRTSEGIVMIMAPGEREAYRVFTWQDEIDPITAAAQR